jgi:hypothetical protein
MEIIYIVSAISLIQYYACWATYRNWFYNEITYCKMSESYSFIAMTCLLPILIWMPIIPIIIIVGVTEKKYLTIRWKFKKQIINK